jgi:CHAT domain-containing protein/tetratricopeptide (TPR) repeat protein
VLNVLLAFAIAAAPAAPAAPQPLEAKAASEIDAGQYAAAVRDAMQAAALYAQQGDVRRRELSLNYAGLASLYAGDYKNAERLLRTAIGLSASIGDDSGRAEQLTNLANVYFFLGRYTDAASNYDAALRVTDTHRDEPWTARRRRLILVNKATLDQRLGRDESALALYREVQSAGTDLRPREQAQILVNLGVLYRHLGDPIKALKVYDDARALFQKEHHVDGELGVLKNRGIVLALDLNQLDQARRNFSDALDRATSAANRREMLLAQLYRGETELRSGLLDPARQDFAASLQQARALKTPEEEWKALYGLGRVDLQAGNRSSASIQLQQAVAVIEAIREAIRVPTLKSDFFTDKRDVYDALISVEIDRADPRTIFDLVERSHSRAWRERLGLTTPVDLPAIQRAMPKGVLLLDSWVSPYGSAVVNVTRDRAEVRRVQVDADRIENLVNELSAGPSESWRTNAMNLAQRLLPVLPDGIKHVIVIADGPLALVPFELLPAGHQLLIERVAVSYAPTAAMLFRPSGKRPRFVPPWTLELRAFADPVFGSAALDEAASVRMRLMSTAAEAKGIASELGGSSVLHLGADDRKRYLYTTPPAPILHIATHATADENAMEQSRILFSPASARLSGADYLFLKEAYALPLQGVELAVLSACDTERGTMLRGEGVQSFSRAFLAAGARSTVTTLWRVPDRATDSFMRVFYHHLQRGASRAEALRQAKLRFLRSGSALSDPHYWAAFVLTGEGGQPVPRAMRWSSVWMAIGLLLIAAIVAVATKRRALPPAASGG